MKTGVFSGFFNMFFGSKKGFLGTKAAWVPMVLSGYEVEDTRFKVQSLKFKFSGTRILEPGT
jgi:hypothetical protein